MGQEQIRLRIDLAYDGAPFRGWARQPGLPSVQAALEDALSLIFREPCSTVVAGRTDTGVHARHQTVHVDVPRQRWEQQSRRRDVARGVVPGTVTTQRCAGGTEAGMPVPELTRRLNGALNRVLGKDRAAAGWAPAVGAVVVRDVSVAEVGFDARFSALSRGYLYRVADAVTGRDPLARTYSWWVDEELDVAAMDRAVRELLGLHDFLSFCKPRVGATTVRELQRASVTRGADGTITVALTADAFCHHMVRSIVGAVVRVGQGRYDAAWPAQRLEARVRDATVVMAPAHGLVLDAVHYPDARELAERARVTRARRSDD
ncbi:tRNA pseudouridine synthase A [Kocuria rhizophila]|uniref:tRNA pseudouridine synthase A n=1 Tax=Kocuria TaxID=57493 RepID=UPI00214F8D07|nr:tRNA pseudouridine synthase A [Kocuria rhizophila]MCR4525014.1 tRNA pseudouridine synthase A [Kocuria rhizophila]MCT1546454.1 tRNA pseudouridine synthase A [Kocuria rhizophila]MCT2171879.1 tRNA pseudouridine synthase A [Kocuria rhizophila]